MRIRLTFLIALALLVSACSAQEGTNANTNQPSLGGGPEMSTGAVDQGGNSGSAAPSIGTEDCASAFESVSQNVDVSNLDPSDDTFDDALQACGSLDELRDVASDRLPELDLDALQPWLAERCAAADEVSGSAICDELTS